MPYVGKFYPNYCPVKEGLEITHPHTLTDTYTDTIYLEMVILCSF